MTSELTAGNKFEARSDTLRPLRPLTGARFQIDPNILISFVVPFSIFLLWSVAAERHWLSPQVLPTPGLVLQTARELFADNLLSNLAISLWRLGIGFSSAVIAGAVLGGLMGLSRRMEAMLYPTFIAIVQIPTLAWIPFLMILLGLGEALKIVVIIKAVVTPVTVYAHIGVRDVSPRLLEAGRVLRLSPRMRLALLILPASLPSFMTGLRLGLSQGWLSLLAVELLASSEGIGFLMVWGRQLFQLDVVFVCITVIGTVGFLMDRGLHELDRHLIRWPRPALAERAEGGRSQLGWKIASPLLLLVLWAVASGRGWINVNLLPSPAAVIGVLGHGLVDGSLSSAMALSLRRAFIGLAIGAGAGFAVGLAMGVSPVVDRLLNGSLTVLRLVAIFAWIPLLTAWVGLGEQAKIAFVVIASFFSMQVATQRGVANLSLHLVEASRCLRLGWLARLRYLILPGIMPSVFGGLRLAFLQSWIGTMGAEYFMPTSGGIGSLMINAQQLFRVDIVFAAMILVGIVAALLNSMGRGLENRVTRWRQV